MPNVHRRTCRYLLCIILLIIQFGCGDGGGNADTTATLEWDPPTTNTDGTDLAALSGYKIYYRTASGSYETPLDVGNVTSYTINDLSLSPETYYFAVTAYDESGNESDYSNEVSKTIP